MKFFVPTEGTPENKSKRRGKKGRIRKCEGREFAMRSQEQDVMIVMEPKEAARVFQKVMDYNDGTGGLDQKYEKAYIGCIFGRHADADSSPTVILFPALKLRDHPTNAYQSYELLDRDIEDGRLQQTWIDPIPNNGNPNQTKIAVINRFFGDSNCT
jgi:hypothetical protein